MSGERDIHDLARQIAVLEERMNTRQAEYESALDRLRANMTRLTDEATRSAAKRDVEAARRDVDNMRWQFGLWAVAIVVIGILIRWPA